MQLRKSGRRKLLVVAPDLRGGGAERVVTNIVNFLDRSSWNVHLGLGKVQGVYLDDVESDVVLHEIGSLRARAAAWGLVRLVRRVRPDALLSTLGLNLAVAASRPAMPSGVAVVVREGSTVSPFLEDLATRSASRAAIYGLAYSHIYSQVDRVICQSEYMKVDFSDKFGVPVEKLRVITNPVDTARVRRLALEDPPRAPSGEPRIISVGRLESEKGYGTLLRAFSLVRERLPSATLVILGEGSERPKLEALVDELDLGASTLMPGWDDNPYRWLNEACLFVSSSNYEGLPNGVLEALVCGVPIVATDCPGGTREVVREGVNGWLVPPESPGPLAAKMVEAVHGHMDRGRISKLAEAEFDVRRVVARYASELTAAVEAD